MNGPYFGGDPSNMGRVSVLGCETFAELVENVIQHPVQLAITQADLLALPEKQQNEAKKTSYIVPAIFRAPVSPRTTGNAIGANLVCIDIDDSAEATRLLTVGFDKLLDKLNAMVWHTARSTADKPRLRVVVDTMTIAASSYPNAVNAVAALLGMNSVTHESKVVVQPMYLPVRYQGATESPIVYTKTDGQRFDASVIEGLAALPKTNAADPAEPDMADIDYLRAPVEEITPEEMADAVSKIPADCSMQTWVEIGMGLKHQFGEAGFTIWDEWSETAPSKYPGLSETRHRWESFSANPKDRVPVTIRTVVKVATENGWNNRPMSNRMFETAREWIRNAARTSEELLDQGAKRIAKLSTVIGPIEQKVLISDLHGVTKSRGLRGPTTVDIAKEVKRLAAAATRAAATQPPWASNIVFLTAPNMFYRAIDNRKMRREVIDLIHRSPNPEISASEYLMHDVGVPAVENLRYEPSQKKRIIMVDGVPFVNVYRPHYVKPDCYMAEEAGALWQEHAINLVGIKYWKLLTSYIAYMVQFPGKKIRWAIFIQSGVGAGKGLVGFVIETVLGRVNVQRLAAEHVLEGSHNGWAYGHQVTIVDEIHLMGNNRYKAMDKFKPLISDDMISVRQIYEPVMTVPNICNYLFFSNYFDALAVHSDDRRYFALSSALQTKPHIQALGGDAYFDRMYKGCRDLAPGLRAFFEAWPICPEFNPEGRAPATPYLNEMARHTASSLNRAISDALEDEPHPLVRRDLVSLTALRGVLPVHNMPPFTDQGLGAILRELGYVNIGRHLVDGCRHHLWTIADRAGTADAAITAAQERIDTL